MEWKGHKNGQSARLLRGKAVGQYGFWQRRFDMFEGEDIHDVNFHGHITNKLNTLL
jgi:hypothetical protein